MSKRPKYMNIFSENLKHITNELTPEEWQCLCMLQKYITPVDCVLRQNGEVDEDTFSSVEDFCEIWGLGKAQCRLILKSLLNKETLIEVNEPKSYIVNPYVMMKGTQITDRVYYLVKNTRWAKYVLE